jgi:hypothetical protein
LCREYLPGIWCGDVILELNKGYERLVGFELSRKAGGQREVGYGAFWLRIRAIRGEWGYWMTPYMKELRSLMYFVPKLIERGKNNGYSRDKCRLGKTDGNVTTAPRKLPAFAGVRGNVEDYAWEVTRRCRLGRKNAGHIRAPRHRFIGCCERSNDISLRDPSQIAIGAEGHS